MKKTMFKNGIDLMEKYVNLWRKLCPWCTFCNKATNQRWHCMKKEKKTEMGKNNMWPFDPTPIPNTNIPIIDIQ